MTEPPPGAAVRPPPRVARAVPVVHAFTWYREAMRLWRVAPAIFAAQAAVCIVAELALRLIPVAGVLASQVLLPLLECGLLYGSLAADRGDRPRMRHLVAILAAPPRAQAAVVLASVVAFAGQLLAAGAIGDVDLLQPGAFDAPVSLGALSAIVAAGLVLSLPFMFVAPIALFDNPGLGAAFEASASALVRNPGPLLLYASLALLLFLFGIATSGLGLVLVLPWLQASSYAAWKDVFGVGD
jgi:uncharacterized membrane protein